MLILELGTRVSRVVVVTVFLVLQGFSLGSLVILPQYNQHLQDISCAPWSDMGRMAAACSALSKPSTRPHPAAPSFVCSRTYSFPLNLSLFFLNLLRKLKKFRGGKYSFPTTKLT